MSVTGPHLLTTETKATTGLAGIVFLSVAPATTGVPIAVGDNDPRLGTSGYPEYSLSANTVVPNGHSYVISGPGEDNGYILDIEGRMGTL